ncbi:MAG: hypothetical protein ACI8PB_005283 [Desulforhopalus sp.]|jgi:hypothetical protein
MSITYLPFRITEDFPSSIVADYDKFLSQVQAPSSYLTKSKHWINRSTLYSLNQDVQTLNVEALPTTDQIHYPLLNFFYHISLEAIFFQIVKDKNKYRFQQTPVIAEYAQLSTTEKYFALFEAFWVYTDWIDVLKESGYVAESDIPQEDQFIAAFCDLPSNKEIPIAQISKHMDHFGQIGSAYIIRILSFFGLLTYKLKSLSQKEQYSKDYIKIKAIRITPFGNVFFDLLDKKRPFTLWNKPFRYFTYADYPAQDFGDKPTKQEISAEPFKRILNTETVIDKGLPILKSDNLKGTITFKVSIDETWRTLSISGKDTLDDLHLAIQEVYSFQNDHLYSFSFDPQRLHPRKCYHSPEGSESPYASKVYIGQLNLYVGQKLLYVFDYGDWWDFSIEVMGITKEPHFGDYKLLQQHGDSPEQYPEFNDDDYWD